MDYATWQVDGSKLVVSTSRCDRMSGFIEASKADDSPLKYGEDYEIEYVPNRGPNIHTFDADHLNDVHIRVGEAGARTGREWNLNDFRCIDGQWQQWCNLTKTWLDSDGGKHPGEPPRR